MIWKYTFIGYVVHYNRKPAFRGKPADRLCLLRVCRQIYVEAVSLPRALITVQFESFVKFRMAADKQKLRAIRNIRLTTILKFYNISELPLSRSVFEPFQSFHITVISYLHDDAAARTKIEEDIRDRLHGKDVIVHHVQYRDWVRGQ
jgi:hypothetical protein